MSDAVYVDPKIGTTVDERFRLEERLGSGGMGVVYKGVDLSTNAAVAVKFLHESFADVEGMVKRFQREAQALRMLSHPHLVNIVDAGVHNGVPYLVTQFLSGESLGQVLDRGAIAPARAVQIVIQVLEGVSHAHRAGVLHRDLKPDNIVLLEGDVTKVLDFGLAKLADPEGKATQLTNTGFAIGTPAYMSPEQARGVVTDERTDLYAVGAILYHMVVGQKPFVSDTQMAVLRMQMDVAPTPPRKAAPEARLSAALEGAILRAMEKVPARRWPSAEAFARALARSPEGGGSLDDRAYEKTELQIARSGPKRAKRPLPRLRLPVGILVAIALLGSGAYGWLRLSRREQQRVTKQIDGAMDAAKDKLRAITPTKETIRSITPKEEAQPAPAAKDEAINRPPTEEPAKEVPEKAELDKQDPEAAEDEGPEEEAPEPPSDTPGQRLEAAAAPPAQAKPATVAAAVRLLGAGNVDEAIAMLYQVRQRSPRSADVALHLGHAYFRKLWRTDGLREYRKAVDLRPQLRRNRTLLRNAVTALDDPTYRPARTLLRSAGKIALPELRRAARTDKNPTVRRRAEFMANKLTRPTHRRRRR